MSETISEQIERIANERNQWQDRAYTAERRVSGLEEERQRLQARVDELQQGLRHLFVIADTPVLERAIAKLAGHRVDCDWLLDGACTCGGIADSSKATKGQGDHYPKEKAVSE